MIDPNKLKIGDKYIAPPWIYGLHGQVVPREVVGTDAFYVYIRPGDVIRKNQLSYWMHCSLMCSSGDSVNTGSEKPSGVLSGNQDKAPVVPSQTNVESYEPGVMMNQHGGKQSDIGSRLDLLPPTAILNVGQVLHRGAKKYGDRNWRKIETHEHLAHAIKHIYEYLQGNTTEDQLSHAATRLLFALEISKVGIETE